MEGLANRLFFFILLRAPWCAVTGDRAMDEASSGRCASSAELVAVFSSYLGLVRDGRTSNVSVRPVWLTVDRIGWLFTIYMNWLVGRDSAWFRVLACLFLRLDSPGPLCCRLSTLVIIVHSLIYSVFSCPGGSKYLYSGRPLTATIEPPATTTNV